MVEPTNPDGAPDAWVKEDDPGTTVSSLIGALVAGDGVRWASFVARYGPFIRHCARIRGLRAQDAEDVMQAVLMRVARRIDLFQLDRLGASFRGWVWTIAWNESLRMLRREGRQPFVAGDLAWASGLIDGDLEGDGDDVPPSSDRERKRRAVSLALAEVKDDSREQLIAVLRDGRSPAEVAAAGKSVGSIWTLVSRFRARVRKHWERGSPEG